MSNSKPLSQIAERATPLFESMQREMGQLLDRFRPHTAASPGDFFDALAAPAFPAIDVSETDDELIITAEIPGVAEDDLDISVSQNVLTVKGEKSSDQEEKEQDFYLVERRFGSFRRRIPLGFTPAENAIKATFKDGVLRLAIAKPEETKEAVQKVKITKA